MPFDQRNVLLELVIPTRSADVPCPLERLMDIIAGEIAFYDPIFVPQLVAEIQRSGTARLKTSA